MPFVEDRDPLIQTLKRVAYTLKQMGVAAVFTPGSSLAGICRWLGETLDEREEAA